MHILHPQWLIETIQLTLTSFGSLSITWESLACNVTCPLVIKESKVLHEMSPEMPIITLSVPLHFICIHKPHWHIQNWLCPKGLGVRRWLKKQCIYIGHLESVGILKYSLVKLNNLCKHCSLLSFLTFDPGEQTIILPCYWNLKFSLPRVLCSSFCTATESAKLKTNCKTWYDLLENWYHSIICEWKLNNQLFNVGRIALSPCGLKINVEYAARMWMF